MNEKEGDFLLPVVVTATDGCYERREEVHSQNQCISNAKRRRSNTERRKKERQIESLPVSVAKISFTDTCPSLVSSTVCLSKEEERNEGKWEDDDAAQAAPKTGWKSDARTTWWGWESSREKRIITGLHLLKLPSFYKRQICVRSLSFSYFWIKKKKDNEEETWISFPDSEWFKRETRKTYTYTLCVKRERGRGREEEGERSEFVVQLQEYKFLWEWILNVCYLFRIFFSIIFPLGLRKHVSNTKVTWIEWRKNPRRESSSMSFTSKFISLTVKWRPTITVFLLPQPHFTFSWWFF